MNIYSHDGQTMYKQHKAPKYRVGWLAAVLFLTPFLVADAQAPNEPLALDAAIHRALDESAYVRQAGAQMQRASAAAGPLSSAYLPSASLSASSMYSQYPLTVTPIREQGVFPALDEQVNEVSLNLSWTVFDFGRGRAARRSAQSLAEAAGVRYDLARMETIERVTSAYVHLAQLHDLQQAQTDRLAALREQQTTLKALHTEGRVPDVELLHFAEVLLTAETDLRKTENDFQAVLLELSAVLNLEDVLEPQDVAVFNLPETPTAGAKPVELPGSSPQIEVARKNLEAARFTAREAAQSHLPSIELFASERLRSGRDFVFDDELYGGIRISLPIFQPQQHVRRQVEQAAVRERQAALERAEQDLSAAARDLANRTNEAVERIAATEARVRHLEETYRIESSAHQEGRLTIGDLLDTEARLAAAHSELAASRAQATILRLHQSVLHGTLTTAEALYLTGMRR